MHEVRCDNRFKHSNKSLRTSMKATSCILIEVICKYVERNGIKNILNEK